MRSLPRVLTDCRVKDVSAAGARAKDLICIKDDREGRWHCVRVGLQTHMGRDAGEDFCDLSDRIACWGVRRAVFAIRQC